MPVEVVETPLAGAQASRLRGAAAKAYERFLDELASQGCAALAYRVTGPLPLDHLCVKHLRGADRVVVAFESAERAWVVLVGAHRDDDPGRNLYDQLYELAGVRPGQDQRRRKPSCCDEDANEPPILDEEAVATLVERAQALLQEGRPRSGSRGTRRASAGRRSPRR